VTLADKLNGLLEPFKRGLEHVEVHDHVPDLFVLPFEVFESVVFEVLVLAFKHLNDPSDFLLEDLGLELELFFVVVLPAGELPLELLELAEALVDEDVGSFYISLTMT